MLSYFALVLNRKNQCKIRRVCMEIIDLLCTPMNSCTESRSGWIKIQETFENVHHNLVLVLFVCTRGVWKMCIGPKSVHISAWNWNKQLTLGNWAFFIIPFPNISSHPMTSQIKFLWNSHFTTVLMTPQITRFPIRSLGIYWRESGLT